VTIALVSNTCHGGGSLEGSVGRVRPFSVTTQSVCAGHGSGHAHDLLGMNVSRSGCRETSSHSTRAGQRARGNQGDRMYDARTVGRGGTAEAVFQDAGGIVEQVKSKCRREV
jgi:hypothetical protein